MILSVVKKFVQANLQINAISSVANALDPGPFAATKIRCHDNKTTAEPSTGSRSAR